MKAFTIYINLINTSQLRSKCPLYLKRVLSQVSTEARCRQVFTGTQLSPPARSSLQQSRDVPVGRLQFLTPALPMGFEESRSVF